MTPLLILLFGIHPATAVGTDLLFAAATKTCGTFVHGLHRTIDWRVVGRLAAGSVPATVITLTALSWLDISGGISRNLITSVLSVALFLAAAALFLRNAMRSLYADRMDRLDSRRRTVLTILVGAVLGTLVSVSSVGAGAIGVTALLLLYPRLLTARIVGSDIAHAVPLTFAAGLGYWILGSIDWHLLGSLLVGSLPGIVLGSYLAARVPDTALRFILATTLVAIGCKLLVQ
jgi:uncharacterized protein